MRRNVLVVLLALSALGGCAICGWTALYGVDDRTEIRDIADPGVRELGRGIAGIMTPRDIMISSDGGRVVSLPYGRIEELSRSARFYDQPAAARCTAALVRDDAVLTAGHCVDERTCPTDLYVFDYAYDYRGRDPRRIPAGSVARCAGIIARAHMNDDPATGQLRNDWALVRLDRRMINRPLLRFAARPPAPGSSVVMLGFPAELPMKAAYGVVRSDDGGQTLTVNIDAFGGTSGAPIFVADTLEVVGMEISGQRDFAPAVRIEDVVTAIERFLAPSTRYRRLATASCDSPSAETVLRVQAFADEMQRMLDGGPFDGKR